MRSDKIYSDVSKSFEVKKLQKTLVNKTKLDYNRNKINNSDNPIKTVWKIVPQLTKKQKYQFT